MKTVFVVAIAMVSGINVFNAQKAEVLSDIVKTNVEALADKEVISGNTGPAETYECKGIFGIVTGNGIMCKSENEHPCSSVVCK